MSTRFTHQVIYLHSGHLGVSQPPLHDSLPKHATRCSVPELEPEQANPYTRRVNIYTPWIPHIFAENCRYGLL